LQTIFQNDKYHHNFRPERTMNSKSQHKLTHDKLAGDREIIRNTLNAIATEVATALRKAGLNYPVYFTIPNSGDSVVMFMTPLDPIALEWDQATLIIREILSQKLGGIPLRSRELSCAMTSTTMTAADITTD
jgi:hypothetical protein